MSLGENLQFLRKTKNITQEDLAEALNVSRQSVSKWESDATFPEMDKIIQICDIFSCSMDSLIKGNIEKETAQDKTGYDKHMNGFSKAISVGVGLCLLGISLASFFDELKVNEALLGIGFFLFILIAVMIFVVSGINNSNFEKNNPFITPFYKKEQITSFEKKFPIRIALGICIILIGLIITIGIDGLEKTHISEALESSILFFTASIGVPILVYNGIQKDKFDIEKYNRRLEKVHRKETSVGKKIQGVIMLTAVIVFLVTGFIWSIWQYNWLSFVIGGILCGIVSIISGEDD
ncbi:MAG: helix-turn-helix domain-containing protein [Ruminococcus sp.]|nr:helix-turn-helix domain-containing protein [Ruminococcus sp.]